MPQNISEGIINQAIMLLKRGSLVAFPTETVYGLGADANNSAAVAKIFAAKGRPANHPVIVHIANLNQLDQWTSHISPKALLLAEKFWPGPLTLILQRAEGVSDLVTGGQTKIGIRIPSHPVAQQLLQAFGSGIAAPSANRFGHVSPTLAEHVAFELGTAVDLILDAGDCQVGIESTIVDMSSDVPRVLRLGVISVSQLSEVLGEAVNVAVNNTQRVSGNLSYHYAPDTPLQIIPVNQLQNEIQQLLAMNKQIVVIARTAIKQGNFFSIVMPEDASSYAHDLYAKLRMADARNCDIILVEEVPTTEPWLAIQDRLQKAANKKIL